MAETEEKKKVTIELDKEYVDGLRRIMQDMKRMSAQPLNGVELCHLLDYWSSALEYVLSEVK
jgi:hypothetical protein